MTLIEILVVVTILGLISSIVGVSVMSALAGANEKAARTEIANIGQALDLYRMRFNRYPSTAEGIEALLKPPTGDGLIRKLPVDPWGAPYVYVYPSPREPGRFGLSSKGPDVLADTDDDVR